MQVQELSQITAQLITSHTPSLGKVYGVAILKENPEPFICAGRYK